MGTWNYLWQFIFSFILWQVTTNASIEMQTGNLTKTTPTEGTEGSSNGVAVQSEVASTSGTFLASDATQANLWSSTALMQGQGIVEGRTTSSSTESSSPTTVPDSVASHATTGLAEGESPTTMKGSRPRTEPNAKTSLSLPATSMVTPSATTMATGEGQTETAATVSTWEGSSNRVSAKSEVTSPTVPTGKPDAMSTGMGTSNGSAVSMSPGPSLAVTSHFSSSPVGSSAATASLQPSSTSGTTEQDLTATSHPSTVLVSSAPSSTHDSMSVGSGAVTVATTEHSPSPSTPSPKPLASTSGTSLASDATQASLWSSTALTQSQGMVEGRTTSSSTESSSPAMVPASVASHATTSLAEGESPTTMKGSSPRTEPNAKTSLSLPATSMVTPSATTMATGEVQTETAATVSTWEGSSNGVLAQSEVTSPTVPTWKPDAMSTVMGTANGSAASMSPGPSLAVTSHFSSSPVGSSAATASLQPSSTSGTTEQDLTATSHPSTVLVSSTPSSTHDSMSVGPGAVTVATTEHSPSPSTPSPMPLASTSGTSLASDATQANLWSSTALTQGQGTVEGRTTSSSTESSSPAMVPASVASHATTGLAEGSSCVPVTVSIQLEKVTSTMIQFRWKPEGGTRDGPYRVRLWGGSREMWNGSLNETSTAFKNLLADNEYQISVDVTTCSKNISTSLTVRTAAEVFNGTTRITNKDFIPEYQNKSSAAFKEFETKFINEIKKHLPQKIQELINGTKMHIEINSLKNGSVIVIFNIVMDIGENITKTEISDAFTGALNMSTVLQADLRKTVIQARNSCQPGLNDCSQDATCTAEGATYSCQCNKGFTDNSPQVPGRVCQRKQNLPSEQMTTVLPKNATAIFTRSTANSGFTTTFSPAPCMPVSIKVQNVTGEEIQFSWTSDRRGSLYTISLVDGNKEINRTTTKETKAVFKRLLPGHLYTVFVAVSSCAENSWTSFRVRTDPVSCLNRTELCLPQNTGCSDLKYTVCSYYQAFACSVLLKNQTFNHALYNSDSEGYKKMSESIKTEVVREMRIKLEDDHFDIIVLGFRPGSVIAYFISLLQNQEPIDVNIFQAHLNQVLRSKFGDQTEVTVKSLTAQSSTENSSAWKVAVIVLGVLLGVALVLILLVSLVYIYMKKRSGKYLVVTKGLLGNFFYKQL